MGLMDRDYLQGKHRQPPFSRPPARPAASTLGMVLVFLAILFVLYKIVDWKLIHGASQDANQPATIKAVAHFTPPVSPTTRDFSTMPGAQKKSPSAAADTQLVTKCVKNGKTSYGDGPCPQGEVASQVITRKDHNLIAAVRVAAVTATKTESSISPSMVAVLPNPPVNAPAAKAAQCQSLDGSIKQLDAMSRQPQTLQMQDWIRDERKKARDQQFRLLCG